MDEDDLLGQRILRLIERYGGTSNNERNQWVLDQIVREITGGKYRQWLERFEGGNNGDKVREWGSGETP